MELRHLRYFVAVAEELHFGRAARRLNMAQPPLSRQIQDLEAELGFALFDRSSRHVDLTEAGREFLSGARGVFETLELATSAARRASLGASGRVSVGYISSLAYSGITELLRAFRTDHADLQITLRELSGKEQLEALKEGRLDVGFVRGAVDDPLLVAECVRREPLMVALPASHPLAAEARLELRQIAGEPYICCPRSRAPAYFDQVMRLCRDAGFTPRIVQEAPHVDIVNLVAAGFGVSILPDSSRLAAVAGITFRPIVGAPQTELLMAWRAGEAGAAVHVFLDYVRRYGLRVDERAWPSDASLRPVLSRQVGT